MERDSLEIESYAYIRTEMMEYEYKPTFLNVLKKDKLG